jgi:hypothetical protein
LGVGIQNNGDTFGTIGIGVSQQQFYERQHVVIVKTGRDAQTR